ncbi:MULTISPECIES: DMT family transporter [unclassified Neptuniibacter]|uniref:DMT family transporter n=1 Tax=unclassified Neptuniibacter TaxID=2630693 RepID=UPI000C52DC9A|nr:MULTISPECIES: DMT family transporter [unclassified Neptuniibacter]MAY42690.1 EamA family transporter [Oceanospirillaceae bacterium]|tara:strand:- start:13286 stop:14158 length:873 start_codon:yes stop_codon:yes gene_type:complete
MTYFKTVMPPAVYYMLLSALGFALMAACVKGASEYGIPVLEIVAARAVVSLCISYIDIKRKRIDVWGQNKGLLIARGSVGAIALLCVYYAVTTLPLAEATIMQYTYPAFTALIALLFLKEKVQKATLLCIVLSLIGLVLMVQPTHEGSNLSSLPWLSVMAALAGALGSAIAYVLVRKLSQTEDSSVIIFYFPLIALPISVIFLGSDFVMPSTEALLLLILVGIFTQVGQVGLTKAMQTEYAGKVSAYAYVQVVFSVVLGFVFFDEIPPDLTWVGGGLIIMGALINVFWKR